jgi:type I restriction enzyme M protein
MVQQIDPKPGEIMFDPPAAAPPAASDLRHAPMREKHYDPSMSRAQMQERALRAVEKSRCPMLCVTNMLLNGVRADCAVRRWPPAGQLDQDERVDIVLTNRPSAAGGRDRANFPTLRPNRRSVPCPDPSCSNPVAARCGAADGSLFGEGIRPAQEHLMEGHNLHHRAAANSVFKPAPPSAPPAVL